jgi:hypothetical protein
MAAAMQTATTTAVVSRTRQSSGYIFIRLPFAKRVSGLTPELTDRRRKRALAANPASDEPVRPNSKRRAAVRVQRLGLN